MIRATANLPETDYGKLIGLQKGDKMKKKTIRELVIEYFMARPNKPLSHAPVVNWVSDQRIKMGYPRPSDVWREIRKLHSQGILINPERGIYMYDPEYDHAVDLQDFSEADKQAIFQRDQYKCVVCGLGREHGINIAVDHKVSRDKGGTRDIENGQTLCYKHNSMKKNYNATEAGKRFIIEIYNIAVKINDKKMIEFCQSIFDAYDEHDVNGHIQRPDQQ